MRATYQCFDITSGAGDVFPEVGLSFAGGASTVLTPPLGIFRCFLVFSGGGENS
ncbi:unnamed protein product [Eruca vesicaria subsp. sativa]|uniref:Uncharacterized protein n=1 Tax=Eruca vesicaria subsp. sativa TaxID=29727 RepID=A0ABC8LTB4_ERUVS|nr:unnamed protein product [Eruca vesicaria subsp. sativa]